MDWNWKNKRFVIMSIEVWVIHVGATVFWMFYWIFNAIDKVAAGKPYWAGKVRVEKMLDYFSSIHLGELWIAKTSLAVIGVLEAFAGILFLISLWFYLRKRIQTAHRFFFWGTATGIFIFGGFIMFDIIVGDRAELLEHTTYWMAIMLSWVVYMLTTKWACETDCRV
ncbi:MAG: hypothetical protein ACE5F4_00660 [Candidatus Paceibacteria bacterium]